MTRVKIHGTGTCPLCERAKNLLRKYQIGYDEVRETTLRGAESDQAISQNIATPFWRLLPATLRSRLKAERSQ